MSKPEQTSGNTSLRPEGKVVTFYSYEGGTGRTLMITNIGAILANAGQRVLMVDFNFFSPGIHCLNQIKFDHDLQPRGVAGYLTDTWDTKHPQAVQGYVGEIPEELWKGRNLITPDNSTSTTGNLALMPVWAETQALIDRDLPQTNKLFAKFSDRKKNAGDILDLLTLLADMRKQWRLAYDYTLIDSPSGFGNVAGACTRLLADHVVFLSRVAGKGIWGTRRVLPQIGSESLFGTPLSRTVIAAMVSDADFNTDQFANSLGLPGGIAEPAVFNLPFDASMLVQDAPFGTPSSPNQPASPSAGGYLRTANRLVTAA